MTIGEVIAAAKVGLVLEWISLDDAWSVPGVSHLQMAKTQSILRHSWHQSTIFHYLVFHQSAFLPQSSVIRAFDQYERRTANANPPRLVTVHYLLHVSITVCQSNALAGTLASAVWMTSNLNILATHL